MIHVPVLTEEALRFLQPSRGGLYLDCTVGLGGHSRALLEAGATRVIGLDRDPHALAEARSTLTPWAGRVAGWEETLLTAARDESPLVRAEAIKAAVEFAGGAAADVDNQAHA